mgnify:CR=1 FL=1
MSGGTAKERTDSLQYISNLEEDLKLSAEIGAALLSENEEMKQQTLELWTELDEARAAYKSLQRRNELATNELKKADGTIAELSQRVQDLKLDNMQAQQRVQRSEEAHSATKTRLMNAPAEPSAVTPRKLDYSKYQSPTKAAHNKAREKIAELSDELTEMRTELMESKELALERRKSRKIANAARLSEESRIAQAQAEHVQQLQRQLRSENAVLKALNQEVTDLEDSYASQQEVLNRQNARINQLDSANHRLSSQNELDAEFKRQEAEKEQQRHEEAVAALTEQHAQALRQKEGPCPHCNDPKFAYLTPVCCVEQTNPENSKNESLNCNSSMKVKLVACRRKSTMLSARPNLLVVVKLTITCRR